MSDVVTTGAPEAAPASAPAPQTAAPTPSEPVQTTPAPATEPSPTPSAPPQQPQVVASGGQEGGDRFELVQDPVTGRRTLRYAKPEQSPSEPEMGLEVELASDATPTSDQAEEASVGLNATPEQYTLEEFSAAIASGEIDGNRVPDEYKSQYADFKIKQAMQAYNDNLRQAEARRQEVAKQLSPEEQQAALRDFYSKLNENARERAMKDLGLTAEKLEEMDLEDDEAGLTAYKTAENWHRQQLINEVQQRVDAENAARQAQQDIYRGIMSFVETAKAQEPNFNAIDQIMQTRYKTLPYEQGRQAEEAINALRSGNITEAQTETLRKYYEDVRREYYAEKNKLSTTPKAAPKPPVVENSFGGMNIPNNSAPDYSALRNATSVRDRKAWVHNFLSGNKPR